ncbi:MAG: M48 family metallopeptidase [Desulfomonile sp.]|nr:M48 family metallopeptidase [Desulfomonile sp.]
MNSLINQLAHPDALPAGRIRRGMWLLLVLTIAYGCASVPHTGRRQFNMVPDAQLNALGTNAFNEIAGRESLSKDEHVNSAVKRVVERVTAAAEATDKPNFKWEVRVLENKDPNAVCLPGGKILVLSGIIPYARNEAGLAAIIAHEVAHAVARHGGERVSQAVTVNGALQLGSLALSKDGGKLDARSKRILGALGSGALVGILLPYSRVHEFEADRIGQIYMARAGYDPTEALRLWERMSQIKKPPIPPWLSTHPTDQDRLRKLREFLPDAMKIYNDAPRKHGKGSDL